MYKHNLFEGIETLRQSDPALKLLRADHLSFIASFLEGAFLRNNKRAIAFSELESQLDDFLITLRKGFGENSYPRTAKQYLDEWSHPESAYLRKYYEATKDEAFYDLTPPVERALEWLRESLKEKSFVGTESRLLTLFQMVREFILLAERDPNTRVRELEFERSKIDQEIEKVRSGQFTPLTAIQAKERFQQIEETSRRLLSDFRQIEENFRGLDRATREKIALSEKGKGSVLDEVFGEHDIIWNSEQGKSFRAFWEFLMSSSRQDELDRMLETVFEKPEVKNLHPDVFVRSIRFHLLEAADKVYRSNSLLIEQLRKYLDDRNQVETRRISELLRTIEKNAIGLKSEIEPTSFELKGREGHNLVLQTWIAETKASLDLVMSRGLFLPPVKPVIPSERLQAGISQESSSPLFNQVFVDERELRRNIAKLFETRDQVTLGEVLQVYPPRLGLSEIIIYFKIASTDPTALIDESSLEEFLVPVTEGSRPEESSVKKVSAPRVIYTRIKSGRPKNVELKMHSP